MSVLTKRSEDSAILYCGLEIPPEVREKMERADGGHPLIAEAKLRDLEYVDVSKRPYRFVKRGLDILLSAVGLVVLILPLLLVSLMIYLDDPGHVIFSQYRVGLHGKRFKLYKLRTMRADTPKYLSTQEVDDPDKYITRIGHTLRKLSIDELPQLFNVLKGDMSLVGPRPLISDEYEIHEMRMKFGVYNVRPGVTGLAQVNGRDMVKPTEKVRLDVEYLREFGIMKDIMILYATVPKVLGNAGVVEGHTFDDEGKEERDKERCEF